MKKYLKLLLSAALFITLLAGCAAPASPAATAAPAKPKVFTYVKTKAPISLDTNKASDAMSGEILYHLSEGLLRSFDGKITPGLAESWKISDDGLTYTFTLRNSVWEDGQPVTAKQFEYSFKRFLDPKTAAPFADSLYPVVNAKEYNTGELTDASKLGIKATDDKTFVLTLNNPTAYFLSTIASNAYFYPLRQEFVEKYGDKYAADQASFLANGPFTLKKWEHEASIRLVKNPKYWNASAVKLDEIVQLIVADANTSVSMYDNNELDYLPDLGADFVSKYPTAKIGLTGSFQFFVFNVAGMKPEAGKVLSNVNFRKALSYAIDREAVAKAVSGNGTLPANRFTHPEIGGTKGTFVSEYPISEGLVPVKGDPEKAKKYLAKALEELGTTADKLPKITYVCMESAKHKLNAEAFLDTWKKVLGITNIEIQILPVPQAIQAGMKKQFDIFVLGVSTENDPYNILAYWVPSNSLNWANWSDPAYTDLILGSNKITDPAKRFAALLQAEKILVEKGPVEPLFFPGGAYVFKDKVTGLIQHFGQSQLIYTDIQ